MMRSLGILVAAGICVASLQIQAHHAISEIYDEERTVVLEGEVTSFLFGNPHSMVHVRVHDSGGGVHTWAVEWHGSRKLKRLGWTAAALSAGDRVKMCGNPGRDPAAFRLYLLNLARISPGAEPETEAHASLCAQTRRDVQGTSPSPSRGDAPDRPR
ncbi:MAG: DUF6152 family protein [Vicinamibacterales bacterium]|jgi:hypothetical protein|nr:DUF6152 family protein [Vicinamibacterales bacterium]MDP7479952.1 DUF6152 family protein [Vicinamibacterales bacterium]MDP7691225.1 DUF6152 family protein [Vicinamibacterales bacterium]HJN46252.1 DUF6152 family protein [Vicinamibacterales bacterium]|tara:strand:- start:29 stop:499 length:471 start_codon:yes stop_codon:yes gene_type:complete